MIEKKMAENFCFAKVLGNSVENPFSKEQKRLQNMIRGPLMVGSKI
jgi:hypothetical protein